MAISLLGTAATGSNKTVTSVSATHTLSAGSNRIAIAIVSFYQAVDFECSGVTYGGVAMTKISNRGNSTTVFKDISAWYLLEASLPANGSKTVTATFTDTTVNANIHVFTIQDAKQQAYEVVGTYLNASSATSSITITTVAADAWAFSAAVIDGSTTYTHGTGQTEITDVAYTGDGGVEHTLSSSYEQRASGGAATQTETAAIGADKHVGIAFSFAPQPAGGSNTTNFFRMF